MSPRSDSTFKLSELPLTVFVWGAIIERDGGAARKLNGTGELKAG
jgi:hypothetical protein